MKVIANRIHSQLGQFAEDSGDGRIGLHRGAAARTDRWLRQVQRCLSRIRRAAYRPSVDPFPAALVHPVARGVACGVPPI